MVPLLTHIMISPLCLRYHGAEQVAWVWSHVLGWDDVCTTHSTVTGMWKWLISVSQNGHCFQWQQWCKNRWVLYYREMHKQSTNDRTSFQAPNQSQREGVYGLWDHFVGITASRQLSPSSMATACTLSFLVSICPQKLEPWGDRHRWKCLSSSPWWKDPINGV